MRFMSISSWILPIVYILRFVGGIIAGYCIYYHASKREKRAFGIPAFVWAIVIVAEPALGVFAYWILHCSNLRMSESVESLPQIKNEA